MKILMLGWELPPHNSGGLGVACYQMSKRLAKRGIDIQFIVPYTAEHEIDFMQVIPSHPQDISAVISSGSAYESMKFINIKTDGSIEGHSLFEQFRVYSDSVCKLVEILEFDVIHAHDWLTFGAATEAKKKTNKPLIVHIHATEYDRSGAKNGNPLVREVEYEAMSIADKVIAVSNHTKQVLVDHYKIPPEKIEVVHNSIDLDELHHIDSSNVYHYLDIMKRFGYKVVVNIGRLTIQKGLPQLLEAAQKVVNKDPKVFFLIVGSGELYEELIMRSAELGITANVLFAGFQRGKAWQDAFKVADLFVMPSISEPFGLTPLESITFGTPALVSKQSGVSEVVKNLLVVDYWDIDEMTNQIYAAVNYDGLKETLLDNAIHEIKKLSWDDTANKLIQIYKEKMSV